MLGLLAALAEGAAGLAVVIAFLIFAYMTRPNVAAVFGRRGPPRASK